MQDITPIREISDLVDYILQLKRARHFFCAEHTDDRTHTDCKERVFTEKEWTDLLGLKYARKVVNDGSVITEEDENNAHKLNTITNDVLVEYGRICAYLNRIDRMQEILRKCDKIYKQQLILEGYLDYQEQNYWERDSIMLFLSDIYPCLLPGFSIDYKHMFGLVVCLYRDKLKLIEENRSLCTVMLKKYTPIAPDVCDQIGKFM